MVLRLPRVSALAAALALSCATPHAGGMSPDLQTLLGQRATLVGTARNARAGAVVLLADGRTLYVAGLEEWPGALDGRPVEVSGTVAHRRVFPEPQVGPAGERSAGMEGEAWVLDGATWRPAP